MKSVIAQGSTVAKAIEEALKKSDSPQEFFVKILEDAQSGFLGFGAKKAKIALFFKNGDNAEKISSGMFQKGSYSELFNNPSIKKQIDNQLKEAGLEVKSNKQEQVEKKNISEPSRYSKMQIRPLHPKSQQHPKQQHQSKQDGFLQQSQDETLQQYVSKQFDSSASVDQKKDENRSNPNKRRRYYRFRRNNNRNRNDQQQDRQNYSAGSDVDNSKKDE